MDFKNRLGMMRLSAFLLMAACISLPMNAHSLEAPQILFPSGDFKTNNLPVFLNVTFSSEDWNGTVLINYYINGKLNQTSLTNTTLNASDGKYTLNVSLIYGLSSSANSTVNFTVDTASPKVYSFNGKVSSNANISQVQLINVTAADDETGISGIVFGIGDGSLAARNEDNWWVAELYAKNFTEGFYNLTATAEDFAGNAGINHVVISEILFDAAGQDGGRVWVEIYNPTDYPVNLSGWDIKGGTRIIIIPDFVIGKKSAMVIANASNFKADYGFMPDMDSFQGDFDFANSNDFIQLRDASNKIIDELSWGNNKAGTYSWPLFAEAGKSIARNPAGADSEQQSDFEPNATPTPRVPLNPDFITIFIDNNSAPDIASALPYIKFEEDSYGKNISMGEYFSDRDDEQLSFDYISNDSNVYAKIYSNNTIRISSSPDWNGMAAITIISSDGRLDASQSTIVEVTPVNDAPVLGVMPDINAYENDLVDINSTGNVSATDIDGDGLAFIYSSPLNASGKWKTDYEDAGEYYANITVNDGKGGTDSKTSLILILDKKEDDECAGTPNSSPIRGNKVNFNEKSESGSQGSSAFSVCNKDWVCGEWSKCDYGLQTRECSFKKVPQHIQNAKCPDASQNPLTKRLCEIQKEADVTIPDNKSATENIEDKTLKTESTGARQESSDLESVTGGAALDIKTALGSTRWAKGLGGSFGDSCNERIGNFCLQAHQEKNQS